MCLHAPQATICESCTVEDIATILREAKRAYYTGEPTMTDTVYDYIEAKLRSLAPDHKFFTEVGYDVSAVRNVADESDHSPGS